MTLKKAVKLLEQEYERAKRLEYIHKPLAYALHRVWKVADAEECIRENMDSCEPVEDVCEKCF